MAKPSRTIVFYLFMGLMVLGTLEISARALLHVLEPQVLAETIHCQHDSLLGWRHIPSTKIPNMYGPGKSLTINGQGFRANKDFSPSAPEGKTRIIFAGDSFAMGYGVGDRHTFQAHLEAMVPHVQTLNMGQGGYGLDQIFLWYLQERERFAHEVLLVCFIDGDINRMTTDRFDVYGKPWLKLDGMEIQVMNVPVPDTHAGRSAAWWARLGLVRVVKKIRRNSTKPQNLYASHEEILDVAMALFWEMRNFCQARGIKMGVVHLPTTKNTAMPPPLTQHIKARLMKDGFVYMDLTKNFQALPTSRQSRLFVNESNAPARLHKLLGMMGHYNESGNAIVAGWLYEELVKNHILSHNSSRKYFTPQHSKAKP